MVRSLSLTNTTSTRRHCAPACDVSMRKHSTQKCNLDFPHFLKRDAHGPPHGAAVAVPVDFLEC